MKEHCLKALWLCRCVKACLMSGLVPQVGVCWGGVLGGVEISLVEVDDHNKVSYRKQIARQHSCHKITGQCSGWRRPCKICSFI